MYIGIFVTDEMAQAFVPEVFLGPECNNRCPFCTVGRAGLPTKSTEDVKRELKMLRNLADGVRLAGGEITTREDISEIVSHARDADFGNICIESNGRLFRETGFVKKMLESGANQFSIAVFGDDPALNDKMTDIKGSFRETAEGIKNMARHAESGLEARVVITGLNYMRVPEIAEFSWGLGVSRVNLSFAVACGSLLVDRNAIPRISDVMPYIRRALEISCGRDIGVSYVPLCFLGGYEKHANPVNVPSKRVIENPNFTITIESELEGAMSKGDLCRDCRFENVCRGIWNGYASLYGFDEIRPVAGSRVK